MDPPAEASLLARRNAGRVASIASLVASLVAALVALHAGGASASEGSHRAAVSVVPPPSYAVERAIPHAPVLVSFEVESVALLTPAGETIVHRWKASAGFEAMLPTLEAIARSVSPPR